MSSDDEESIKGTEAEYPAMLAIVGSLRMRSKKYSIFQPCQNKDSPHVVENRLRGFDKEANLKRIKVQLHSIQELAEHFEIQRKASSEMPSLPEMYAEYFLDYIKVEVLNFNDTKDACDFTKILRAWPLISRKTEDTIYYNEFTFYDKDQLKTGYEFEDDYKVVYDVLLLLGIRRQMVFSDSYGTRIYNLVLPPGRLIPQEATADSSEKERRIQSEVGNYLALPVITLIKKPRQSYFRSTFSISIILLPVDKDDWRKRRDVSAHELSHATDEAKFKIIDSPLKDFIKPDDYIKQDAYLMSNILRLLAIGFIELVYQKHKFNKAEWTEVYHELLSSQERVLVCIDKNFTYREIEQFNLQRDEPKSLRTELRKLVNPKLNLLDDKRYANFYPDTVDFKLLQVIDRARLDSSALLFYNSFNRLLASISIDERFPLHSIKWVLPWVLYMCESSSSIKCMIHSFYREIDPRKKVAVLEEAESELVDDVEEIYDLDILAPIYKDMYEKMKELSGTLQDFKMLKEKLGSLKTNLGIREQKNQSEYIIILTLIIAILTGFSLSLGLFSTFGYPSFSLPVALPLLVLLVYQLLRRRK